MITTYKHRNNIGAVLSQLLWLPPLPICIMSQSAARYDAIWNWRGTFWLALCMSHNAGRYDAIWNWRGGVCLFIVRYLLILIERPRDPVYAAFPLSLPLLLVCPCLPLILFAVCITWETWRPLHWACLNNRLLSSVVSLCGRAGFRFRHSDILPARCRPSHWFSMIPMHSTHVSFTVHIRHLMPPPVCTHHSAIFSSLILFQYLLLTWFFLEYNAAFVLTLRAEFSVRFRADLYAADVA